MSSKYEVSKDITLATLGTIKDPSSGSHIVADIRSYDGAAPKLNIHRWIPEVVKEGKVELAARQVPLGRLSLVEALQFAKLNAAATAEGGAFWVALEAFVATPATIEQVAKAS